MLCRSSVTSRSRRKHAGALALLVLWRGCGKIKEASALLDRLNPAATADNIERRRLLRMDDYLPIQEFAQISGVEASTLRYWDEMGLFSPIHRNPENNYRFYSLAQLFALHFITTLRDLEIPLKTIAELREERDPDLLLSLLEKQEHLMDLEMSNLRLRYSIIHARRELINMGFKAEEGEISIMPMEEKAIILWPPNEYTGRETFVEPLAAFIASTGEHHINLSFPVGGYHESFEAYRKAPGRPDCFFSIDPFGGQVQSAGDYLVGYTRGSYGELEGLPVRMSAHAEEHGIKLSGPVYTMYLYDEICVSDSANYLARSCASVSKR